MQRASRAAKQKAKDYLKTNPDEDSSDESYGEGEDSDDGLLTKNVFAPMKKSTPARKRTKTRAPSPPPASAAAPASAPASAMRKPHICRLCGQPKKNHVCTYSFQSPAPALPRQPKHKKPAAVSTVPKPVPPPATPAAAAPATPAASGSASAAMAPIHGSAASSSSTAGSSSALPTAGSSTALPAVPPPGRAYGPVQHDDFVWQFENYSTFDHGTYTPTNQWDLFPVAISKEITHAVRNNMPRYTFSIQGSDYMVDLVNALQVKYNSTKSTAGFYLRRIKTSHWGPGDAPTQYTPLPNQKIALPPLGTFQPQVQLPPPTPGLVATAAAAMAGAAPPPSSSATLQGAVNPAQSHPQASAAGPMPPPPAAAGSPTPQPPPKHLFNGKTKRYHSEPMLSDFSGNIKTRPDYWKLDSWSQLTLDSNYKAFEVPDDEPVFDEVFSRMDKTIYAQPPLHPLSTTPGLYMRKLFCLVNEAHFSYYQLQKETMLSSQFVGRSKLNETWLYHGTRCETFGEILKTGLSAEWAARSLYGKGVYTSTHASYSVQSHFAVPMMAGTCCAPWSDVFQPGDRVVLMGRGLCGNGKMSQYTSSSQRFPPVHKDGTDRNYDCFYNHQTAANSHMRIFLPDNDKAFYPEFAVVLGSTTGQ